MDNKQEWPPINQEFDKDEYPSYFLAKYSNFEKIGRGDYRGKEYTSVEDVHDDMGRIALAVGITDFQITCKKTSEEVLSTFHFKNKRNKIARLEDINR